MSWWENLFAPLGYAPDVTMPIPSEARIAPRTFFPGTLAPFNNQATGLRQLITGSPTIPTMFDSPSLPSNIETRGPGYEIQKPPGMPSMPASSPPTAQPESDFPPGAYEGMRVDDPTFKQPQAPAPAASPSMWERLFGSSQSDSDFPIDINRRVNFGKNALLWQTLASIGGGMINRPKYQGFMGALGEGLKAGGKTATDFPMNQLKQALGEAQVGNINMQMAQKMAMLKLANGLPAGHPLKMPLMMAASGMDRFAAAITPKTGEGQMITSTGKAEELPGYSENKAKNEAIKQYVDEGAKIVTELRDKKSTIDASNVILNQMEPLVDILQRGGAAGYRADDLAKLKSIAKRAGVNVDVGGITDPQLIAIETMKKLSIQLASAAAKGISSRPTQMEWQKLAEEGVPNPNLQAASIRALIASTREQYQRQSQYANEAIKHANVHGRLEGPGIPSFNEYWKKNFGEAPTSPTTEEMKRAAEPKPTPPPPKSAMSRQRNGKTEYYNPKYGVWVDENNKVVAR